MSSTKPHHEADPSEISENQGVYTFKPRALNIIWGNDNRYWNLPKPRSDEPAELLQVSWLEVTGATKNGLPKGKYEVRFQVGVKQGAFGWAGCPLFMMAKVGKKGKYFWKRIKLSEGIIETPCDIPPQQEKFEIEVKEGEDTNIYFGLYEVWTGKWKGGLLIYNATVKKIA